MFWRRLTAASVRRYAEKYDLNYATDGLGKEFEMLHNGFKRYSSLASSHASVDNLRAIRERHNVKGGDVASVYIETTAMVQRHCGWPYVPSETITAQMNLPYTAAVTLLEGNAFIDQYTDDKLRDPTIMNLADRVEVVIAPDLDALRTARNARRARDRYDQVRREIHVRLPLP